MSEFDGDGWHWAEELWVLPQNAKSFGEKISAPRRRYILALDLSDEMKDAKTVRLEAENARLREAIQGEIDRLDRYIVLTEDLPGDIALRDRLKAILKKETP